MNGRQVAAQRNVKKLALEVAWLLWQPPGSFYYNTFPIKVAFKGTGQGDRDPCKCPAPLWGAGGEGWGGGGDDTSETDRKTGRRRWEMERKGGEREQERAPVPSLNLSCSDQ